VLAYVSCHPRTLARDAAHFAILGLRLERAEPLDMIPWSDAVEALTWFTPSAPPEARVLFRDEQLLAAEKAPHQLLSGDDPSTLLRSVQALPGWSQAVPLERWGDATSGVCWFARNAELAEQLAGATRDSEVTLLVRGNLRKQGTITRRHAAGASAGTRYHKLADVARHSLTTARIHDTDERGLLGDFAAIRHPVLGDGATGDPASNRFVWHRHALDRPFVHIKTSALTTADGLQRRAHSDHDPTPDLNWVLTSLRSDQT
jgi:hypothetical protein